jgi:hypothetical protein
LEAAVVAPAQPKWLEAAGLEELLREEAAVAPLPTASTPVRAAQAAMASVV